MQREQREPQPGSQYAVFNPLYGMAMRQMQMIARRAIRRLEVLCKRYPDPVLRNAVEALRREVQADSWRTDAPHLIHETTPYRELDPSSSQET